MSDTWVNALSALGGAVVGGLFTLLGAWWQAKKSLHAARLERLALLRQDAAARIVDAMFEIKRLAQNMPPDVSQSGPLTDWRRQRDDHLERARSYAFLLPDPQRERVDRALRTISSDLPHQRVVRHELIDSINVFADDVRACLAHYQRGDGLPEPSPEVEYVRRGRQLAYERWEAYAAQEAAQLAAETVPEPDDFDRGGSR